jgi:2'-5' RNA ligase
MPRQRTFLAVPLGAEIRDRCAELQEELAGSGAALKWVEHENLHLTLLFLGEVDLLDSPKVCRAAAECCAGLDRFAMTVEGVGCFPNPRRPRVVWASVTDGAAEAVALHDALERPLLELGCYRREERQYTPHVTLGRVNSEGRVEALAAAIARRADWSAGTTEVSEVHVMSSELRPQGPVYTVLSRAKLRLSGGK